MSFRLIEFTYNGIIKIPVLQLGGCISKNIAVIEDMEFLSIPVFCEDYGNRSSHNRGPPVIRNFD